MVLRRNSPFTTTNFEVLDMLVVPRCTVALVVGGRAAASGLGAPISWRTDEIRTGVGSG